MAKIKPFKAVIYNQQKLKDLSSVVCPPYDIISPQKQKYYHSLSPYNLIHILLGQDISGEDKYIRAGNYFRDWLKDDILIQDTSAAMYFYSQQYNLRGEKKTRLGFISLLHLDDKNPSVFSHEHTRLEPKEDRLRLLKQVKANLSPIFVIFLDSKRIIQRAYQQYIQGKAPFIDVIDSEKINHKLWRLDSLKVLDFIQSGMQNEKIFIADGHHRYEVACAYRDEMKLRLKAINAEESFDYILAYFTNANSGGLAILPVHRLVKLNCPMETKELLNSLGSYFGIEEFKEKHKFFFLMEKAGHTEHILGMYKDGKYWLLRLKNIKILDKEMCDKPKEYRSLDISILNHIILKKILTVDLENKETLKFSPNAEEFIKEADTDPLCVAFFLNPVKIAQVTSIALKQERFPSKSTYFYPKVLSGLVINKHEE